MQGKGISTAVGELDGLSHKIEAWRGRRPKTRPMPQELWSEACAAARRFGAWQVARRLRLNYHSLRRRMRIGAPVRAVRSSAVEAQCPGFIELTGLPVLEKLTGAEAVVEAVAPDGTKLAVRLRDSSPSLLAVIDVLRGRS